MPSYLLNKAKQSTLCLSCILLIGYQSGVYAKNNDKTDIKIRGKSAKFSQQQASAQRIAKEDSLQKLTQITKKTTKENPLKAVALVMG